MRIFGIQKSQSSPSYQGTPQRMYGCTVRNYQDALKWWENLRFSKYLDAHCNDYYDKAIRADNYSFLDKLTLTNKHSYKSFVNLQNSLI